MAHLILKPRHTLIGKGLLPMILKFKSTEETDIDVDNFARLKKDHPLVNYSLDELATEFLKLTGEELKDVMLLTGMQLNLENSRKLMHQTIIFANLIGAPKASIPVDPRTTSVASAVQGILYEGHFEICVKEYKWVCFAFDLICAKQS